MPYTNAIDPPKVDTLYYKLQSMPLFGSLWLHDHRLYAGIASYVDNHVTIFP